MLIRRSLPLLAALLTAIAVFPMRAQKSSSDSDPIAKIRAEWASDMRTKQLDKLGMLYSADALFYQPDGTRIVGRAAISELCKGWMATYTSDLTFISIHSEVSGTLAYDSGDFTETMLKLSDGTKTTPIGSYFMVFKRQSDGTWQIIQQVWTDLSPEKR